jgi:hypothetical protein
MPEEAERLRHRTDQGRLADKVDFPDPATAPLGTDDEAAGRPPDREAVARSTADQEAIAESVRNTETDSLAPPGAPAEPTATLERRRPTRNWLVPAIAGLGITALVIWAIWLTFPA